MSALLLPVQTTDRRHGRGMRFRAAFLRVFNLPSVAVVFYVCLLVTIARWLPLAAAEGAQIWWTAALVNLRQALISGLLALASIALVRAWVISEDAPVPRRAMAAGFVAALAAALVAAVVRLWVFGTPLAQIQWNWLASVLLLWTMLGTLGYALVVHVQEDEATRRALQDQRCRAETLRTQKTQAHLSALQAQIEPHFLFNTLANVKRLYETAPDRGREMLGSLIDYLRAALPSMRQAGTTVGRELDLARAYLTVLKMRMGDRLTFRVEAPDGLLDAEMPPLVLATLVENAIKHGLGGLPEGGRIDIRVHDAGPGPSGRPRLQVDVIDTGAGFTTDAGGSGVGLANTRSRLAALYGDEAALTLSSNAPRGVVASVLLPLRPLQALETAR